MNWFLRTNISTILTFYPGKSVDYLLDVIFTFPFQIHFQMHLCWWFCGKAFCTMNLTKKWSFSVFFSDINLISEEQLSNYGLVLMKKFRYPLQIMPTTTCFGGFVCDNYARDTTIQRRKLLTLPTWLIHTSFLPSKWNLYPKIQFLA